jgi:CBS domain-containing protein
VVVVDEQGAAVGIVSMTDLLREARLEAGAPGTALRVIPSSHVAREVMRSPVIGVDDGQPIRDAAKAMVENRIHRVVVRRGGRAVGVVSTRDVMRAVQFHHIDLPLSRVMTTKVETIGVGASIEAAIARLGEKNVRGLVVVDGEYPVGIFTQAEAFKARALPDDVLKMPVEEVMSYEIITSSPHAPLYRVAAQAVAVRARRVLVVETGKLEGIVTGFDLACVVSMVDMQ